MRRGRAEGLRAAAAGALALPMVLFACCGVAADEHGAVGMALVLAVDVSGSIDDRDFALQRAGYAAAFRDPRVVEAIRSAGAIAVTCLQWAGARDQEQVVQWTVIGDGEAASLFAERLGRAERRFENGSTAIGGAIDFAAKLLSGGGLGEARRVIDISGNGDNNSGRLPGFARDEAVAAGITINGLAILDDDPLLDRYYAGNVVGGPGAFVMTASGFPSFAEAILRKLVKEIAATP